MIECEDCGAENPSGHKFCSNCGAALSNTCPNCGTVSAAGHRFCFNCGTALADDSTGAAPAPDAQPGVAGRTERRFVSVLFADLVSFTSFSERRDPEDVRSMLTVYFERCREIVERYGGEIDKFIGDAVMAVWGAVAAHEDDAERATRAALELVEMVAELGGEIGVPELAARAGVLSGDTAVGPGGNEKGLVVGDLVNTASRLQSIAPPGGVLVGESTRDLARRSIEFVPAGEHQVKGKEVAVKAYRAVRVLSELGRAASELLQGPFVGRDDELRALRDQLHATGREGKARLVSIVGEGGIGKTRLSQELLRYIDGIAESIYYHHGRSPSYGDGVTFWALGEMVRQRAGIAEGAEPAKARMRLRTMVADYMADEEDQRWIEPRLAALIGLADMPPGERPELFAALRTFFQRISDRGTVLMVFEDLHWADDGLLDFIDELVERSPRHPILVVTLARPELIERRPDWGASRKRTLSMHLSRLEETAMQELVGGWAPGLPEPMVKRVAERSAGVPLYAVEFIRMLVNAGRLVRKGDHYRYEGGDEDLAVPDSLSAIIGARLDRLDRTELAVIQDASVLGYSFALPALSELRGSDPEPLEGALRNLVRREILEFEEDSRSPERGQYRFVQSLIREVAYGRLTKAEKVARHLHVAAQFEATGDVEVAGIVASHYANAAAADPSDTELAEKARRSLITAAERAGTLHSHAQAVRLYDQAIALTDDESLKAALTVQAARSAHAAGIEGSAERAMTALEWYREVGDEAGIVIAATEVGNLLAGDFRADEAVAVMLPVYEATPRESTREWAELASATARSLMLADRTAEAVEVADAALSVIEDFGDTRLAVETLINKGTAMANGGRWLEGTAALHGAAELARLHDMAVARVRALNNLSAVSQSDDQRSLIEDEFVELIERTGNRSWLIRLWFFNSLTLLSHGRYDEALSWLDRGDPEEIPTFWVDWNNFARLTIELLRGGFDPVASEQLMGILDKYADSDDPQLLANVRALRAAAWFEAGHFAESLNAARQALPISDGYPYAMETGLAAAVQLGDAKAVKEFHSALAGSRRGRVIRGLERFAATLRAAMAGDLPTAEAAYRDAERLWEDAGSPATLALMRATTARAAGPDTALGAEAATAARAWYEAHGTRLYLDLLADCLPPNEEAAQENMAV